MVEVEPNKWTYIEKGLKPQEVSRHKPAALPESPSCECADSPLDPAVIDNIKALHQDNMPDILGELIQIYLSESEKLMQKLSRAVEQSDTDGIFKTAHTLKSSSGNMGAMTLTSLCGEIEKKGKCGATKGIKDDYNRIILEYQRVQSALKKMMSGSET